MLEEKDRIFQIKGMGHSNIWYGNEEVDNTVISYIDTYDKKLDDRIIKIEKILLNYWGKKKKQL